MEGYSPFSILSCVRKLTGCWWESRICCCDVTFLRHTVKSNRHTQIGFQGDFIFLRAAETANWISGLTPLKKPINFFFDAIFFDGKLKWCDSPQVDKNETSRLNIDPLVVKRTRKSIGLRSFFLVFFKCIKFVNLLKAYFICCKIYVDNFQMQKDKMILKIWSNNTGWTVQKQKIADLKYKIFRLFNIIKLSIKTYKKLKWNYRPTKPGINFIIENEDNI